MRAGIPEEQWAEVVAESGFLDPQGTFVAGHGIVNFIYSHMMNAALLAIGGAIWLICEVIAYGGLFACLQKKYPSQAEDDYRGDMSSSIVPSLFGPLGLITAALSTGFFKYGFKFY